MRRCHVKVPSGPRVTLLKLYCPWALVRVVGLPATGVVLPPWVRKTVRPASAGEPEVTLPLAVGSVTAAPEREPRSRNVMATVICTGAVFPWWMVTIAFQWSAPLGGGAL